MHSPTENPTPATISDLPSLVIALQADGASPQVDAALGEVRVPIQETWLHSALILRWDTQHTLLHLLLPIMDPIRNDRISATESLIVQLNHRLVMPGFGMDGAHRTPYFRMSVPRGSGLPFVEVLKLLRTAVGTVRDFLPLFIAVAQKGVSVANALAQHRSHEFTSF